MKVEAKHYFAAATERIKQAIALYRDGDSYALAMYTYGNMDELESKVRQILEAAFPEREELELHCDDGLTGVLVSRKFEGVEAIDRQDQIWSALDRRLTPEEKRQVQIIVAATPEEHAGHTAAW
jgi:acid stress-induced BolA-like protein IbaG/YrbA